MRAVSGPREVAHHCFLSGGGAVLFPTLASVLEPTNVVSGETTSRGVLSSLETARDSMRPSRRWTVGAQSYRIAARNAQGGLQGGMFWGGGSKGGREGGAGDSAQRAARNAQDVVEFCTTVVGVGAGAGPPGGREQTFAQGAGDLRARWTPGISFPCRCSVVFLLQFQVLLLIVCRGHTYSLLMPSSWNFFCSPK